LLSSLLDNVFTIIIAGAVLIENTAKELRPGVAGEL
jgi:hypothetical protein